ncbi:AP-3 complex subunit sigma-like protein [Tanacetum coccineum]
MPCHHHQPIQKQHDIIRNIYSVLCNRAENVSNFVQADSTFGPNLRLTSIRVNSKGRKMDRLREGVRMGLSENEHFLLWVERGRIGPTKHCITLFTFSCLGLDTRLVYKTFATLYFIVIFDESENELAILDLMQVFVETLDKCFSNVCELDIVFNFSKVHTILNEIILGGQVVEMSSAEVVKSVDEISWQEKNKFSHSSSNAASGWQRR